MDAVVASISKLGNIDVAKTIEWLTTNDFAVTRSEGPDEVYFGNATVEFRRRDIRVQINRDRGIWNLDISAPKFDYVPLAIVVSAMTLQPLSNWNTEKDRFPEQTFPGIPWSSNIPDVVAWLEKENRRKDVAASRRAWSKVFTVDLLEGRRSEKTSNCRWLRRWPRPEILSPHE